VESRARIPLARAPGKDVAAPEPVAHYTPPDSLHKIPRSSRLEGWKRGPADLHVHDTLERVYWDHRQGLYTLALSITRNTAEAEDAVQEACARLCATRARPNGKTVPYVFAAVRNAAVDLVRRRARAAVFVRGELPVESWEPVSIFNGLPESPEATAIDAEQHQLIREALDELPDDQREAVVMRVYGGLTFEEIAETLGEPLPTVASRYRRALERMGRAVKGMAGSDHA